MSAMIQGVQQEFWQLKTCMSLLQGSEYGTVQGPRPAEAAAAMRVAAEKSLKKCSGSARLLQSRDRRLLGLIEASLRFLQF